MASKKFKRPAVQVVQGNLILYLTYVTPRDLFEHDHFYTVEKLEPQMDRGFQRVLEPNRVNRLARHLEEAEPKGYANLPTTIFLATASKKVKFDDRTSELSFRVDRVCPLSVVDGQHRIDGLKRAIGDSKETDLWDFKLPATIAVGLDDTHQMYHFYIVNTTQRPVDKELGQQITKRFTDMDGVAELPYLPHWFDREVKKGADAQALRLIEYLNEEESSPLCGRVRMANQERQRGDTRVKQGSLVILFKQHVLTNVNPIFSEDIDKQKRIMLNYLLAVKDVFVDSEDGGSNVVFRGNGLFFFSLISKWVFAEIYSDSKNFSQKSISQMFMRAVEDLHEDYSIGPKSWRSGGRISGYNRASLRTLAEAFFGALQRSSNKKAII